ncbi:MAG: FHA domain-containing protein [Vicinamibacteria bacterium]
MSILAIELNDTGIEAVSDSDPGTEAISPSPGVVVLDGETLLTGRKAASRARLKPRWTYDRFWEELDTTPLPRPFPRTLRRADLAHAHLKEIWESTRERADDVVLAIPGCFSHEQLGLVLGIARACGMPVTGMIDSSLASSTLPGLSDQGSNPTPVAVHLDLHLHRTVATRVDRDHQVRGEVKRGRIEVNDDVGLVTLFDAWVKLIAQVFVRTTRFDPLHRGESEQALYLRLPGWLDELRREDKTTLVMEAGGKDHSIEITREQIVACAQPFYEQVAQLAKALEPAGQQTTLLVSKRMAELPGLEGFLRLANENLVALPCAAGAKGALKLVGRFRSDTPGEELPFVTQIALSDTFPVGPVGPDGSEVEDGRPAPIVAEHAEGSRVPTHVLYEGLAHPITSEPFVIGLTVPEGSQGIDLAERSGSTAGISRSHCSIYRIGDRVLVEDHSSYGSFLNDKRIETKAILAAGDCLRVGTPGAELRLIAVMDSDGTPQD